MAPSRAIQNQSLVFIQTEFLQRRTEPGERFSLIHEIITDTDISNPPVAEGG